MMKSLKTLRMEQMKDKTKRIFKKNEREISYQTLRLYNENLSKLENTGYLDMKFVGVGGDSGKEEIWDKSLLAEIKTNNP